MSTIIPQEPGAPGAMAPDEVRLVALGGLGEVGMNCLAIEQGDDLLLVDCGVTFPSSDLGIDLYYPRLEYVLARRDRLRGVVLTHGHEDHIGALPYLLDELDVPVYGPPHAIELVRARLAEHGFEPTDVRLRPAPASAPYEVGSFGIEPVRVTHSIADATALAIRTRAGLVLHTGDFKLDPRPPDGEPTDEARLEALGREGVRLLLSDSTNVDSPGWSRSETDVGAALEAIVLGARTRVVVGMFASNVQRLLSLGAIAMRAGRRICLLGRSVGNHVRAAQALGRLRWPSDLFVPPDVAATMPRERVLVVAGGTQAERAAALPRLANGTHPVLRLDRGDVVILSSRIIPGNDRPVFDMMGDFLRAGIELHTRITAPSVHASGHAHRDEELRMIELASPRAFLPVHGTLHHLMRHAELARDAGVGDVLVAENGEVVLLRAEGPLEKVGRVPVGRVATFAGDELADDVVRERSRIGRSGVAFIALVADARGVLVAPPSVHAHGVVAEGSRALAVVRRAVARAVDEARANGPASDAQLSEAARVAARRAFDAEVGQRPPVTIAVTRV